ncbi:MAG: protein kinase [Planctomycetota bacterium]
MDDDASPVELQVLEHMLADCERDGLAPLERYLAAHPGYENIVRRCHQSILTPTPAPAEPPQRLGPFLLHEVAGRGGQGVVWRAEDPRLGRQVALKVLSPQFAFFDAATRSTMRRRFEREAIAASRVNAPGICTVYEVGESDDVPWIAMQWIDGSSLDRVIGACSRPGTRPHSPFWHESMGTTENSSSPHRIRAILELFVSASRAVHTAHAAGLVHRDLKPGNIMLTPQGTAVVLDFGLALNASLDDATLTLSNELLGSPAYMAPEQIEGDLDRIGKRTDIYALGVTLFECLSRRRPFEEPTRHRLFAAIRSGYRPDLRKLVPAVSRDLSRVVACATDPDPQRRFSSAGALAEDLQRILDNKPIRARTPGPLEQLRRTVGQHPVTAAVTIMLALLLVIVVLVTTYERAKVDLVNKQLVAQNAQLERSEKGARWMAFVAGMRAAGAHYDNSEFDEARRQLEQCPEEHRGFAWRQLWLATDQADADLGPSYRSAASRDGAVIANAIDALTVQILDGNTGRELGQLAQLPEKLRNIALDGTGQRIAVGTAEGALLVYDRPSMELVKSIQAVITAGIWLSPNGRHAALRGIDNSAIIVDLQSNAVRRILPKKQAFDITFVDDAHVVTTGTSEGIRLWHVDGTLVRTFGGRGIVAVTASYDGGLIAAATTDILDVMRGITLFRSDGVAVHSFRSPHRGDIAHLAFRADGNLLVSSGLDRTMHVWRMPYGQRVHTIRGPWIENSFTPWVSADGKSVIGSSWHRLILTGLVSNVAVQTLPRSSAVSIAMSSDPQKLLVADSEGMIHVHDTTTGRPIRSVRAAETRCSLSVAPQGKRVAAGTADGEVLILDEQLKLVARIPGTPDESPHSMAFAPGHHQTFLRLTRMGKLFLHSSSDGSTITATTSDLNVRAAVFAPDGEQIFAGIGQEVVALDPSDLTLRKTLFRPGNGMSPDLIRVSPNGRWLAATSSSFSNPIGLWDLTTGTLHRRFRKHDGVVRDLQFTRDSSRIAACWDYGSMRYNQRGTLRIWHAATGELLSVGRDFPQIRALEFDPKGDRLWLLGFLPTGLEGRRARPHQLADRRHKIEFWPPAVRVFTERLGRNEPFALAELLEKPLPAELRDEVALFVDRSLTTRGGILFVRQFLIRTERSDDDAWVEKWCQRVARKEPDNRALQATHALALLRMGQAGAAIDEIQQALAPDQDTPDELAFASAVSALIEIARDHRAAALAALARARTAPPEALTPLTAALVEEAIAALGR